MATTNLFVELLVIGIGAACWVGLLILAAFGIEITQSEVLNTYPVLVSLLAIVYLLGIISDRIADFVFDKCFSGKIREQFFDNKRDYQDSRRLIFDSSDRLADMHEYGRTRIRICRGWSLNAVLIAVCLNVFLQAQCHEAQWFFDATRWGTAGCLLLALSSWWSWRLLCLTEYLKIREHAEFLAQRNQRPRVRNAA
jgi:hypothetical protein